MDSVPRYEFYAIFVRVALFLNLKGKFTAEAIAEELENAIDKCRRLARKADTVSERNKLKRAALGYGRLIEYGFHDRVIREARMNPNGIIGMTLKHGYAEAKNRILAQKRAKIRSKLKRKKRWQP
jgi:hypothetical protein